MSVMNFNRIRDLASNLGCKSDDGTSYIRGRDCLETLEKLEEELDSEDVVHRDVRITLHVCGIVREDLIPILMKEKDARILAVVTRVLVNLSLPPEYLLPLEEGASTPKQLHIHKQLALSTFAIQKAFLNVSATLSIVTTLREAMINSEKHHIQLTKDECTHLKNCLTLLCNLLHLPENAGKVDRNCVPRYAEWRSVQNKLIWNLFVQGMDGALILMLNSKYCDHWTIPLGLIIAFIYQNQSIRKVHRSFNLVSSASESSGEDEESDSLISKPCEKTFSDSGCPLPSESSELLSEGEGNVCEALESVGQCLPLDIHKKLEKVQISDDSESASQAKQSAGHDSGSPFHKKMKSSSSPNQSLFSRCDSAIDMDWGSPDGKSSDDDNFIESRVALNLKAVQKLKNVQMQSKLSESDSSTEDLQRIKVKWRNHPSTCKRGKSPRRSDGCVPSICIASAFAASHSKGRMKYPLWEKRNSVSTLVDIASRAPSDDDIGFLIKEFTLSFLHSGFSDLVIKIKNLLLLGPCAGIDKSLFFWMLSYFLHLATTAHLSFNHVRDILSTEVVTLLVFECIHACEKIELQSSGKYVVMNLNLLVLALREVLTAVDLYFRKACSPKDKMFFHELYCKLGNLHDFRQIPLLLFHTYPKHNSPKFLGNVIILNHCVVTAIERSSNHCQKADKMDLQAHLRQYAAKYIVDCYVDVLERFKVNGRFLNECAFTFLHHLAGDVHSAYLLLDPAVLKLFSNILKEETELDQYQEDLILYILNKFRREVQRKRIREKLHEEGHSSKISDDSSSLISHNMLSEEDDDLFWWYLQFEQDKDPISRISEHVSISKQEILTKLKLKGVITAENLKTLEEKMLKAAQDSNSEIIPDEDSNFDDDITRLLFILVQAGERPHLIWLQDLLLNTCYVKLGLEACSAEPVPFYSIRMMLAVPLVPYTSEQRTILSDETFLELLQKLGLQLGCKMYPRIPLSWTAGLLYRVAERLGPLRKEKLKFSNEELITNIQMDDDMVVEEGKCPPLPPLSSCGTLSSWLTAVQQNKEFCVSLNSNHSEI